MIPVMDRILDGMNETSSFAKDVFVSLRPEKERATILTLSGDLGSGKTAFTKEFAKALGIEEPVVSPTFVLGRFYEIPNGPWRRLLHVDAYRLDSAEEIRVLRWDELVRDPTLVIVVEWPERIVGFIEDPALALRFSVVDEAIRKVERIAS